MGSISTGIGLISGINTAALIEQLLALEGKGKLPLQQKVASLAAKRTALLDVNSRLLNLKSAASKFRIQKVFQSALATSSDDSVLSAFADASTATGAYQFYVKRLAASNQLRTKGYATSDFTPLGLDSLSFEFGDIGVRRSIDLASLNGGNGVSRGKIVVTDKSGATATVDLSLATTLEEVVATINSNDDASVTASIEDERLVITDASGGAGQLKVANATGSTTASDLGIAATTAGDSITSSQIHTLGLNSALSQLNDGNGVLIRDGVADFRLQLVGSVNQTFNIDLGREDAPITAATKLSDLNNGLGVKINSTDAPDFKVITSTGVTVDINLGKSLDESGQVEDEAVTTVGELINRVNDTLATALGVGGASGVELTLNADGSGFVLTDNLSGGEHLRVIGAGPNGDTTAKNLGIFTGPMGSGPVINGTDVPNKVETPRAATIQDLIDRINAQTDGNVVASINASGTGIALKSASGTDTVTVLGGAIDGSSFGATIGERTARDLGIFGLSGTDLDGTRVLAGANTLLVSTLNGGKGLDHSSSLTVQDAAGNATTLGGLDVHETLEDLLTALNEGAAAANVQVTFGVSADNVSLTVTDTSNGTAGPLTVIGGVATALGIGGTPDNNNVIKGSTLQMKYVDYSTSLSSLNFGKGLGTGVFKLTDSAGNSATVDIDSASVTMYDVIQEINSRGLAIEARINESGDGILLIDTNPNQPTVLMKVEDTSGGVASTLGIKKSASELGGSIEGSFERVVDLDPTDTLKTVVSKINAAGIAVSASVVNTGAGGTPFYLSISSTVGGKAGRMLMYTGGVDLGLTTISEGRDAEILFGNTDPAQGLVLRSSTNLFADVVGGLDVTALKASNSLVTVDVARDTATIKTSVNAFVTAFNDAIGRINDYDSYDVDTKKKGVLLGDPTLARARGLLYTTIQGKAKNVSGQYQYLSQVGIKVGKDGNLTFDEAKFDAAYAADPTSVEKLFATFEQETVSAETVAPGVTVGSTKSVATALGFGDLIDKAMQAMTSTIDGAFTKASESFQSQIDRTNARITAFDAKLEARKTILQRQFAAMEDSLARMQSQQSALTSIFSVFNT